MLAAPENNLFIVGDDDQSIYAFGGAKPEIMMNFPKDFPSVQTELLSVNYRSTKEIVDVAGRVISWNKGRFQKKIQTENEQGKPLVVKSFQNGKEEELYLKDCLVKAHEQGCPFTKKWQFSIGQIPVPDFWWNFLWSTRFPFRCEMWFQTFMNTGLPEILSLI